MAPLLSYYYRLLLVQLKSLWSADSTFYYFSVTLKLFTITSTVMPASAFYCAGLFHLRCVQQSLAAGYLPHALKDLKAQIHSRTTMCILPALPRSWNIDESRNTASRSTFKRISSERVKKESYRLKLTVTPVYSPNPESEAFSYSARLCYGRFQHASSDLAGQSVHLHSCSYPLTNWVYH